MKDRSSEETGRPKRLVGIAASAGGLEAMTALAQYLPINLSCAYVLAQHMSPTHKSLLSTLLSRETRLSVVEVDRELELVSDTIYVPVPGQDVVVSDGCVRPLAPSGHPAEPKPSADRLFASVARDYGNDSVVMVLSGTGSDGSYGVQDVREAGGITIAQDPASSKYDTMPLSAIETGCVDLVLPARDIGRHLEAILKNPRNLDALQDHQEQHSEYFDLFQILLARSRVDFRDYKDSTINRRIQRRMIAKNIESYEDYVTLCRTSPDEVDALYRDLLISVTRFFRDKEQFDQLKNAIDDMVLALETNTIRVWIAGCATGEEAYSIAMLLNEAVAKHDSRKTIQIFATDIDEAALERARAGTYPLTAQSDIPQDYLTRYFEVGQSFMTVSRKLRRQIIFSHHNVFQDPPFVDINLTSMRNTLIYFNLPLQERVLTRLQYALRPGGLIFLGTSENLGSSEVYFDRVSSKAKVYRKRQSLRFGAERRATRGTWSPPAPAARLMPEAGHADAPFDATEQFEALANVVAPIGFLANRSKEVLRIFGDISAFCAVTDVFRGPLTTQVLKPALASETASLIPLSLKHRCERTGTWRELDLPNASHVRLRAFPIVDQDERNPLVLISIETQTREVSVPKEPTDADEYTAFLERELSHAREALQVTTEELQTSNEELQSTNEELQSANEELQSTNEELETSNEELQSTNEELITVNEELLINTNELVLASAEREGILLSLPVPLMTVDHSLEVRKASQGARRMFGLRNKGSGFGHISQVKLPKGFPALAELCNDAVKRSEALSRSFPIEGYSHELRISPYFNDTGALSGLTILVLGHSSEAIALVPADV